MRCVGVGVAGSRKMTRILYLFLDCLYVKRLRVLCVGTSEWKVRKVAHAAAILVWVNVRDIFSKLATDHLFGDLDFLVCLAIVNSEADADEVGQNGCAALLSADRRCVWGRRKSCW